jgi:hypothetical protein
MAEAERVSVRLRAENGASEATLAPATAVAH